MCYETMSSLLPISKDDPVNIYQKTQVIGMRAIEIISGHPLKIDAKGEIDPVKIARTEYERGLLRGYTEKYLPKRRN